MESKTIHQVKVADVGASIAAALSQPDTKFIVVRAERNSTDGKFDNVEVSIVTEDDAVPPVQPVPPAPK